MRRRRPRSSWVLLALSVLIAAASTLALRGYLTRLEAQAAAGGPGRPVVVAAVDLSRGTTLTPESLESRDIPADLVPPGAVTSPSSVLGRPLAADVLAGEVITSSRLAAAGGPVASLVPEGLRAVPVTVDLPPGTVAAGDLVDVMATYATGQAYTETVVEAAEILSAERAGGEEGFAGATTIILLVAPDAAERLAFARAFADISVAVAPATEPAGETT
jgi:pilus assembly protein CpaB